MEGQIAGLEIAIIGAGSIGISFAAAFADAGAQVIIAEPDAERAAAALTAVERQIEAAALAGLAKGGPRRIRVVPGLAEAVARAALVIEAGPERLEVKRAIFAELLALAPSDAPLATASSAMTISAILPEAAHQARCLVAHPVNPPAVLRLIELVPAPGSDPEVCARAAQLFRGAGFAPVVLGREIEGFVLNRLQGAVLREAYRLVADGVTDVEGVETVMRMGLGPRWALSGPFETAELNTPGGITAHAARMGPAYRRMGEARGETDCDWNGSLVADVERQRRAMVPAEDLDARRLWRAKAVARLVALRDRLTGESDEF